MYKASPVQRAGKTAPQGVVGNRSTHPSHKDRGLVHIALVALVLVSALLMTGCGSIAVTNQVSGAAGEQRPAASQTGVPNTQEQHDLAVAAVDFDPVLDIQQILAGKPYALLVAVENKGNRTETQVAVSARLVSAGQGTVLVSAQRTVSLIAAGDIAVVRFNRDSPPPLERSYILKAAVQPAPHETTFANNERVLRIDVNN